MHLPSRYQQITFTGALIKAKDKLGDSFGTNPYLSTGRFKAPELSQNCAGKQTDLNTMLKSS
jgi:hypothetical protein